MDRDNKKYNNLKLQAQIINIILLVILFIVLIFTDLSKYLRDLSVELVKIKYISFLVFVFFIGGMEKLISLPADFFSGYILEHRFNLSNQSLAGWIKEEMKGTGISILLFFPILLAFYFFIIKFDNLWWIPTGILIFFFGLLLTKIAPLVIFPLFYKFNKIEDEELRNRLTEFSTDFAIKVEGVFSFNLSKDTKKANAAFAGLGKTKRILLADNLLENFSTGEILSVFSHEVGHYKLKHIIKLTFIGFFFTFTGLFLVSVLFSSLIGNFGFNGISDIAAFPLLGLLFFIYMMITMPLQNSISRKFEKDADRFAVKNSSKVDFTNALNKLKDLNLADPEPHPFVEFVFYSHPSISKRIKYL
ncbi:M48 family metallopeptidase [candidate division KSB1 bacterium]